MLKWRDAKTDPPRPGKRVIARCYGFTGEGYTDHNGRWMRGYDMPWKEVFDQDVLEWTEMPETLRPDVP